MRARTLRRAAIRRPRAPRSRPRHLRMRAVCPPGRRSPSRASCGRGEWCGLLGREHPLWQEGQRVAEPEDPSGSASSSRNAPIAVRSSSSVGVAQVGSRTYVPDEHSISNAARSSSFQTRSARCTRDRASLELRRLAGSGELGVAARSSPPSPPSTAAGSGAEPRRGCRATPASGRSRTARRHGRPVVRGPAEPGHGAIRLRQRHEEALRPGRTAHQNQQQVRSRTDPACLRDRPSSCAACERRTSATTSCEVTPAGFARRRRGPSIRSAQRWRQLLAHVRAPGGWSTSSSGTERASRSQPPAGGRRRRTRARCATRRSTRRSPAGDTFRIPSRSSARSSRTSTARRAYLDRAYVVHDALGVGLERARLLVVGLRQVRDQ